MAHFLKTRSESKRYTFATYHPVPQSGVFMEKAKVFWSGRSQAVRLPKEFRMEGLEVRIRRHGVAVILEPIPVDWAWLDALSGPLEADFLGAVATPTASQSRDDLDAFFTH
jgi:antitoxin VapB